MKITSAVDINLKKLRFRTGKALYLIIPISVLVVLSVIISSQVSNIETSLGNSVFEELGEESTLLQLEYQMDESEFVPGSRNLASLENSFSEVDLSNILSIDGVETASINYTLPIANNSTEDLFEGKDIKIRNLTALSTDLAGMYTGEDFSYDQDTTEIPIILNSNSFVYSYEDWGGETTLSYDFEELRAQMEELRAQSDGSVPGRDLVQASPVKNEVLEYEKDDLIGQTFTIDFGGLDNIQDYEVSRDGTTTVFTKLTDAELTEKESDRKEVISSYWDYSKISAPQTYTFKVVGVIEDQTNRSSYIPESFANVLIENLISNQLDARTSNDLSIDTIEDYFTGLYFDGSEITTSLNSVTFGPGGGGVGRLMQDPAVLNASTYSIPGLVLEISPTDSTIESIYTELDLLQKSLKSGEIISIKVDNITSRESVIKEINRLGYAYIDYSNLDVLANIENTLSQVSTITTISFILLTGAIIILTMSKFVSESTKEIGIFRAIGFTKANILSIFTLQGMIYTGIAYVFGIGIGILLNVLVAPMIGNWFDGFVQNTVAQSVNVVSAVDTSIFYGINTNSIVILSITLLIITLVLSIIPAYRASNISPVEAIKSE